MNTNPCGGIVFLTLIAGRKQKEALLDALFEAGGRLINVVYGYVNIINYHILIASSITENDVLIKVNFSIKHCVCHVRIESIDSLDVC